MTLDRHLYHLRSRNLLLGVYDAQMQGFVGVREKLGSLYLDTEYHHDIGAPLGTATPVEDLGLCPLSDLTEGQIQEGFFVKNQELFDWLQAQEAAFKAACPHPQYSSSLAAQAYCLRCYARKDNQT